MRAAMFTFKQSSHTNHISNFQNGEPLMNETNLIITTVSYNHTTVVSTVDIKQMNEDSAGKYECAATNGDGQASSRFFNVIIKGQFFK